MKRSLRTTASSSAGRRHEAARPWVASFQGRRGAWAQGHGLHTATHGDPLGHKVLNENVKSHASGFRTHVEGALCDGGRHTLKSGVGWGAAAGTTTVPRGSCQGRWHFAGLTSTQALRAPRKGLGFIVEPSLCAGFFPRWR